MSGEASDPPIPLARGTFRADLAAERMSAGLVLVSTPIGNLADFTARAAACLADADLVLCEDTRVTSRLLTAWGITCRLETLHEHNETARIPRLLEMLGAGKRIALVSDAGTPVLSDPGFRLVREALKHGLRVSAAPGANAAVMALSISGLPPAPYLFLGYPPPKSSARQASFETIRAAERAGLSATLIWHEAPHRILEMLEDLGLVFGAERACVAARELTKRFEEVVRTSIEAVARHFHDNPPRGEFTVLLGPPAVETEAQDGLDDSLAEAMRTHSVRDAAALVAGAAGLPKRTVYARALELAKQQSTDKRGGTLADAASDVG